MSDVEEVSAAGRAPGRPLRVAALIKQVPLAEVLELGPDGRLRREGTPLEMNPYCRRAVSKGVELARESGGSCTVVTLGPPSADDVLREAVAWGADDGVHLSDPAFAGSDTLATARALAAALGREGPFDLVLVGRNSTDGDTAQVGPEVAELLDLPFAAGARQMSFAGDVVVLGLEQDDGFEEVEVDLPAVVSVAERLTEPAKVDPEGRRAVPAHRIRRLGPDDLGPGPWGDAGSRTKVGAVRLFHHHRAGKVLAGPVADQVAEAVRLLEERGALDGHPVPEGARQLTEEAERSWSSAVAEPVVPAPARRDAGAMETAGGRPIVGVMAEWDRPRMSAELVGAASRLADEVGGEVVAFAAAPRRAIAHHEHPDGGPDLRDLGDRLGAAGAGSILLIEDAGGLHPPAAEDAAMALSEWARHHQPWVLLAPSTIFGREVAARTAAALGAGLVGDAVGVDVVDGELVAAKPAFSGALVADITCTSAVRLVTVRPGVLPVPPPRQRPAASVHRLAVRPRRRVRSRTFRRDDDLEVLARAEVVIGVGTGVQPGEYSALSPLASLLDAELAATRKVTDKGWAPRSRQVGITGRSIAPRLYVALGLSGKFNHMVGVRAAGTVLAVNPDPAAPVFEHADIGIVADWHDVVPRLADALRARAGAPRP